MKEGMQIIRPILAEKDIKGQGTVVLGTVKGDLYDIGKNLVSMMLEGAGFDVVDLGIRVPPEKFAQEVKNNKTDIVGMSDL